MKSVAVAVTVQRLVIVEMTDEEYAEMVKETTSEPGAMPFNGFTGWAQEHVRIPDKKDSSLFDEIEEKFEEGYSLGIPGMELASKFDIEFAADSVSRTARKRILSALESVQD